MAVPMGVLYISERRSNQHPTRVCPSADTATHPIRQDRLLSSSRTYLPCQSFISAVLRAGTSLEFGFSLLPYGADILPYSYGTRSRQVGPLILALRVFYMGISVILMGPRAPVLSDTRNVVLSAKSIFENLPSGHTGTTPEGVHRRRGAC